MLPADFECFYTAFAIYLHAEVFGFLAAVCAHIRLIVLVINFFDKKRYLFFMQVNKFTF